MSAPLRLEETSVEMVSLLHKLTPEIADKVSVEHVHEMFRVAILLQRYARRLPEEQKLLAELSGLQLDLL